MKRLTLSAVILLVIAGAPSALGSGAFSSESLVLSGNMVVEGSAAGLLALDASGVLSWEAVASSVTVVREYANRTQVEGTVVEVVGDPDGTVRHAAYETFGASRLQSGAVREDAAFLATADGGEFDVTSSARGFLEVVASTHPTFGQDPVQVDAGPGDSPYYGVQAELDGQFVNLTSGPTTLELRGTFTFQLFDVDYVIRDDAGTSLKRTGIYEIDAKGPVRSSRIEIHTVTLTDGVLILHVPSSTLYASAPAIDLDGTLRATGASGDLMLEGTPLRTVGATAEWRGATTLLLSPDRDAVRVSSSDTLVQGGAMIPTARIPWVGALLVVSLAGIAVVATVLLVRRSREAPDLEAALLAMEEHRWGVALRHIDGLLANGPADALLLVDRAICLEETGRLVEARASYEDALREQPSHAEAHYYYARVLTRLRVTTASAAHLSRALAIDDRLIELARKEPAFRAFRDHPQFLGLLAD